VTSVSHVMMFLQNLPLSSELAYLLNAVSTAPVISLSICFGSCTSLALEAVSQKHVRALVQRRDKLFKLAADQCCSAGSVPCYGCIATSGVRNRRDGGEPRTNWLYCKKLMSCYVTLALKSSQQEDLNKLNVIHVTGTKGKGSTCAFTDSIIRHARPNWKVGESGNLKSWCMKFTCQRPVHFSSSCGRARTRSHQWCTFIGRAVCAVLL
jgi:hypothetical protein